MAFIRGRFHNSAHARAVYRTVSQRVQENWRTRVEEMEERIARCERLLRTGKRCDLTRQLGVSDRTIQKYLGQMTLRPGEHVAQFNDGTYQLCVREVAC